MAGSSKRKRAPEPKPRSRPRAVAWALGAAALGIGAGIALERTLVGRTRLKPDKYATESYGKIRGDRTYPVRSFDGASIVADEVGPPTAKEGVVFLHGFCLDRKIWHHQYRAFDPSRRYVFYDARHHGECSGGSAPTDTHVMAADLKAVLDETGLDKAILVGHSMGGMTVLEFCREHPLETDSRIAGMVLVNTTYTDAMKTLVAAEVIGPLERRTSRIVEGVLRNPRGSRLMRLRGDDFSWLLVKLMGFGPNASPAQIEFVHRLLMCFPSPHLIETLRGLRAFDMEEALARIDVPTLIVAGGDDRITTVRASKKMAEEIKGSRLVVFDRAGHMSMLEKQEDFNQVTGEFFDEVFSGSTRVSRPNFTKRRRSSRQRAEEA